MSNNISQGLALKHSTLHVPAKKDHLRQSEVDQEPTDDHLRSVVPSPVGDEDEDPVEPSLRVGLVVHRAASGFALRANNLHSYLDLNRFVSLSALPPKFLVDTIGCLVPQPDEL